MDKLKCGSCNKHLTTKTEVEYSQWLEEYYCNFDCATNRFFGFMACTPFDVEDRKHELKDRRIKVKKGKFYDIY